MDCDIKMDSVDVECSNLDDVSKMVSEHDGYFTDGAIHEISSGCYYDQFEDLSDNEKSHELLRLVTKE
jgi:hypothetical protein